MCEHLSQITEYAALVFFPWRPQISEWKQVTWFLCTEHSPVSAFKLLTFWTHIREILKYKIS